MNNPPIQFKYSIMQMALIVSINSQATILARADRGTHHEYRCIWWSDGKRNDDWLIESELR